MPGSHGGGHGGGGGSFGGGRSSTRFSRRGGFPGSVRCRYYNRHGKECVFYYSGVPKRPNVVWAVTRSVLLAALCVFVVLAFLITSIPKRLSDDKCIASENTVFDIDDHLTSYEEDQLKTKMNAFYEKTGVEPAVYLCNYSSIPESYFGKSGARSDRDMEAVIENFAYDTYLDTFDDEGHWLIVFCKNDNNIGKSDSTWLDMAGDDTGRAVTDSLFDIFRDELQGSLKDNATVGEGLCNAFDVAIERSLEFEPIILIPVVLAVGLFTFLIVRSLYETKMINDYCNYNENKRTERKNKRKEGENEA